MSVQAALSVGEYLHSGFPDLDREYRHGELVQRTLPDYLHGKTQGLLVTFVMLLRKRAHLYPCTETRMRLSSRVPSHGTVSGAGCTSWSRLKYSHRMTA